jgi:hypothetical protein
MKHIAASTKVTGKPEALRPIRTYAISLDRFGTTFYSARSPSKARAQCYRAFCSAYQVSFKEFLKLRPSVRVTDNPPYFRRAVIAGRPGTIIYSPHKGIRFMRDDSDEIFSAHPSEIVEISAEKQA